LSFFEDFASAAGCSDGIPRAAKLLYYAYDINYKNIFLLLAGKYDYKRTHPKSNLKSTFARNL
jgi:hypothetical protein